MGEVTTVPPEKSFIISKPIGSPFYTASNKQPVHNHRRTHSAAANVFDTDPTNARINDKHKMNVVNSGTALRRSIPSSMI